MRKQCLARKQSKAFELSCILVLQSQINTRAHECEASMSHATALQEKARRFEQRAEQASDPISRQHYKEMAAHYRSLAVEHLEIRQDEPVH